MTEPVSNPQKATKINVQIPTVGYRRSMFFTRFCIERIPAGALLHFGFVSESGFLYDSYSCFLPVLDLDGNKERLTAYVQRLPDVNPTATAQWTPVRDAGHIDQVRFVQMARINETAETLFLNYPFGMITMAKAESRDGTINIVADPVAILTSSVGDQKALIMALYG